MTAFHFAAEKGLMDVCKHIIEKVDNKNPAALNGCTPLHLAADEGHLEIVRLIVETGVNKNSLFDGMTPLNFAGLFRSYTFYKLLSNDNTQLYGRIFVNLMYIQWYCFIIALFIFVFELIFFAILSCWTKIGFRFWHIALGTLIDWGIAVLLTFMILLKKGHTGKALEFKYS